jgi:putative membrane protein
MRNILIAAAFFAMSSMGALMSQTGSNMSKVDQDFAEKAYQINLKEIDLAKIAQQRASSDAVKEYAQHLMNDHTDANNQLEQIARNKNISLPSEVDQEGKAAADHFSNLSGTSFDRQFIQKQIEGHKHAIALFESEARNGHDPDLKSYAASHLNALQQHETAAAELLRSFKGTQRASSSEKDQSGQLPRTGSQLPSTALIGILLMCAALIVRHFRIRMA